MTDLISQDIYNRYLWIKQNELKLLMIYTHVSKCKQVIIVYIVIYTLHWATQ